MLLRTFNKDSETKKNFSKIHNSEYLGVNLCSKNIVFRIIQVVNFMFIFNFKQIAVHICDVQGSDWRMNE